MSRIDGVPSADRPPDGPFAAREVTFEAPRRVRRRGFFAVMAAGAMTLGVTALSWVPLARPARAEPGSEYMGCGRYGDGPGGAVCHGYPYSEEHCGEDGWFLDGCYTNSDGSVDCYRPLEICRAGDEGGRNAWRWKTEDEEWRCADGEVQYEGAPNPETVICSAELSSGAFTEEPPTTTTPTPTPTPTEPTPGPVPPLPGVPSLPSLPLGS